MLRRQPGRAALFILGLGLLVAAFFENRLEFAVPALTAGVVCCLAALLTPWLREFAVNLRQGEVSFKTREPAEVVATAVAAEEPSQEKEEAVKEIDEHERQRADARHLVATAAVDQLLHPTDGPLVGCEFRLFFYFADRGRLLPVLDPDRDPERSEGWAPGQGVTGEAWRREDYVLATGSECSDGTYGLTASQQQRYRRLAAVAAAPVFNASGRIIAVLSASSEDANSRLLTEEGREEHLALAAAMSRVLVDLLFWERDG